MVKNTAKLFCVDRATNDENATDVPRSSVARSQPPEVAAAGAVSGWGTAPIGGVDRAPENDAIQHIRKRSRGFRRAPGTAGNTAGGSDDERPA